MHRLPAPALLAIGLVVVLVSAMGLAYSVHTSAKVVYTVTLAAGIAALVAGWRKRSQRVRGVKA